MTLLATNNARTVALAEAVCRETLPACQAYLEDDKPDICVLATKTAIMALRYFEIEAKPLAVRTAAMNLPYAEFLHEHGRDPEEHEVQDGEWMVAIDVRGTTPGRFAGHLVARLILEDGEVLLDPTFAQFARPARGIILPHYATFTVPIGFGDTPGQREVFPYDEGRSYVIVESDPLNKDYTRGGDWRKRSPIAGPLIRKLRREFS